MNDEQTKSNIQHILDILEQSYSPCGLAMDTSVYEPRPALMVA
jgi:hypothetical protein